MKCAGAIVGLVLALATHVEAAEIKVISTGGARAVMTSLVPEFERKSGHKVSIDFGTPGNMRDRLLQGEAADVAVAIAAILPDLEKAGKIASGTRMEFAASYVGVAVRAGAPKLDVSTPDGVKRAMLMAKTVALCLAVSCRQTSCRLPSFMFFWCRGQRIPRPRRLSWIFSALPKPAK
jgi:molybdate transport system substrate-binding protein